MLSFIHAGSKLVIVRLLHGQTFIKKIIDFFFTWLVFRVIAFMNKYLSGQYYKSLVGKGNFVVPEWSWVRYGQCFGVHSACKWVVGSGCMFRLMKFSVVSRTTLHDHQSSMCVARACYILRVLTN